MAASKELITKIVLKGSVDGSLTKAFQALAKNSDTSIGKLSKIGETASKAFKAVATATAAGAVACAKAAIDFESAFAGVRKTVDETNSTSYEDLSNGIRQLAKETPAAATEIAEVAAAAGQLGIKADDILSFSKTMIDLGESTNLTADEAATSIAKLFNVTGTSMNQVGNFGATLVALGNNAATTESDILAMASRIAGSGKQIGLTEQQILALSTSLSSVGIEAEMGGSAISTTMSQIDKDVASGSETLAVWAETAGMSTKEFSKAWNTDAYGALQKVLKGMATTKDEGGNLNILLEELGINGIRQGDTLKRLSSATGLMAEMTNLANSAWSEGTALSTEANTRYATTAARLEILRNKIVDAAITIGDKMLPAINKLIDKMDDIDFEAIGEKIGNAVQWIIDNFDKVKVALNVLGVAFATFKVAGFINTVSGAVKEINNLWKVMGMTEKLKTFASAVKNSALAQKIATAAQWLWNTSIYGCPIIWIIAAIAALIAIIVLLVKNWDKVKEAGIKCWEGIKNAFAAIGEWLKNAFSAIGDWFVNIFTNIGNFIKNAFNSVVSFFAELPAKIGAWLAGVWQNIVTWGANLWAKAKEIGSNFLNGVVNFFKELPYKIGYCIGYAIGKVIQFGQKLWNFATTTIPQFIGKVVDWFKQLPSRIWTWLVNVVTKIGQWGTNMFNKMKTATVNAITAVVNFFATLPSKIWNWLVNTITRIGQWGSNMIAKMRTAAVNAITAVVNFFAQLPSKIWTWLVNVVTKVGQWGSNMVAKARQAAVDTFHAIVDKISEIPGKMLDIGKNIVEGLWNGLKNAKDWLIGRVKSFASGIVDGIKSALGINSPSVVMEKVFKWVPVGAGNGIINNAKYAVNAVKSMGSKVTDAASKITPTIGGVSAGLQKFATGGTVTRPQAAIVGDAPETIVPHGNTPRNRALLSEAAAGVGASVGGNYTFHVTFAPVINGGNVTENRRMLQEEEEEFKRKMDAYFEEKVRLAF